MPRRKFYQTLLLTLVILFGMIPLFYFLSMEVGIVSAATEEPVDSAEVANPLDRYIDNVAFGVNEKLSFDINYGFINAGTATMEVAGLVEYNDRPCYRLLTKANSNSFFSSIYNVEDRVESIVDALGIYSWRFEKNLREGSYSSDRMYEFDQLNHTVNYKDSTITVPAFVQDAISVLYYVRTQELKVGESIYVDNFVDGRQYSLEVKVVKKETIEVDAGNFDCILVEPLMQSVGVFKHSGKLKVWLTDDRLKMPVLMKSKVLVGSISAELTDYKLGELEVF